MSETTTEQAEMLCECGKVEGSFACKIRHVHMQTLWAESSHQ